MAPCSSPCRWRCSPGWCRSSAPASCRCCPATFPSPPASALRRSPPGVRAAAASCWARSGSSQGSPPCSSPSVRSPARSGRSCVAWQRPLTIAGGILSIVLGLVFTGWLPLGQGTWRLNLSPRLGLLAAPLLGIVFGLGWTPCIGPALSVVLTLALNEATALRGGVLAFVYAIGLGLPFVVAGLAFDRFAPVARLGQAPPPRGAGGRRRRHDGRRRPAGHRLVGRPDGRPAAMGEQLHRGGVMSNEEMPDDGSAEGRTRRRQGRRLRGNWSAGCGSPGPPSPRCGRR